jgi:hypothetical protein
MMGDTIITHGIIQLQFIDLTSKLPIKNDGKIYSSKHLLSQILSHKTQNLLTVLTMAMIITGHIFITIIP